MRRDEDYMIVNEGEIWRCSGMNDPYDYFVLYVGAGFITGYVVSTYGPKSRDEHAITVDDVTYWYHPAKINYIRKNRLDYRICEAVSDQVLHTARWYLTTTIGCGEYITQLRNECRTLKNRNDVYDRIFSNASIYPFKNIDNDHSDKSEQRLDFVPDVEYSGSPITIKNEQPEDLVRDDGITFNSWHEYNDYVQTTPSEISDLTPAIRTRSANFLHRYLNYRFGLHECLPISKKAIMIAIRDSDFIEFKSNDRRLGKKGQDFLREIFPLSSDEEEDDIYEE